MFILGWFLYLFIMSRTVNLPKFGFFGLPIQFGASLEIFSIIYIYRLLNNYTKVLSSLISSFASICI